MIIVLQVDAPLDTAQGVKETLAMQLEKHGNTRVLEICYDGTDMLICGGKTMPLAQLATRMCNSIDCDRYDDGGCPAASYCRVGHNGMLDWLREVLKNE